ncbi:hypothetical protein Clacol_002759 [Clathrus columnatus]|uniref:Major facilitator superfamily (MFS) profile domain-containing protein n=1 Tax=Clathrus columnatus TaxID=1419009 RepID=A0AAV5A7J4_9AGAM|nr:hypothetical protein Clacol_002759 [Clathrus columnatus]
MVSLFARTRREYSQIPVNEPESTKIIHFDDGSWFSLNDDGSHKYAYGPSGFRGLFHNSLAFRSALFASLGGLMFGYDQGVIANVLVMKDFISRWPITPWQKGLMTAVLELGALIGTLAAGTLADRFSRRGNNNLVLFCLGSTFQTLANSIPTLTLGRAIGGAVPGSLSWRLPLGVQILPGLLLGFGCFVLPPSPRVLIAKGQNSKAITSLHRLRSTSNKHPLSQLEFIEIQVDVAMTNYDQMGKPMSEFSKWAELFDARYLRRTLTGIAIMFWQQWSGINALLYYGPSLIEKIGFTGETAILAGSGFVNIAQLIAVVPTILSIDKLGMVVRRRLGFASSQCMD